MIDFKVTNFWSDSFSKKLILRRDQFLSERFAKWSTFEIAFFAKWSSLKWPIFEIAFFPKWSISNWLIFEMAFFPKWSISKWKICEVTFEFFCYTYKFSKYVLSIAMYNTIVSKQLSVVSLPSRSSLSDFMAISTVIIPSGFAVIIVSP